MIKAAVLITYYFCKLWKIHLSTLLCLMCIVSLISQSDNLSITENATYLQNVRKIMLFQFKTLQKVSEMNTATKETE
jgi:hypothetical protein